MNWSFGDNVYSSISGSGITPTLCATLSPMDLRVKILPRHGQTRHLFISEPHSHRTHRIAVLVLEGVHPAVSLLNPCELIALVRLVIPCELLYLNACHSFWSFIRTVSNNNSSWVTWVSADQFVADKNGRTQRRSRKLAIKRSIIELFIDLYERVMKCFLIVTMLSQHLLIELWQSRLDETRHLFTILTMSITHAKEVTSWQLQQVRIQKEVILIHLIGIVWYESHSGSKSELSDYVHIFIRIRRRLFIISITALCRLLLRIKLPSETVSSTLWGRLSILTSILQWLLRDILSGSVGVVSTWPPLAKHVIVVHGVTTLWRSGSVMLLLHQGSRRLLLAWLVEQTLYVFLVLFQISQLLVRGMGWLLMHALPLHSHWWAIGALRYEVIHLPRLERRPSPHLLELFRLISLHVLDFLMVARILPRRKLVLVLRLWLGMRTLHVLVLWCFTLAIASG